MTPALAQALQRDVTGVRAFLTTATTLDQPTIDAITASGIAHYHARELLRRLHEAGEITASGWEHRVRAAYRQLLAEQTEPGNRLQRTSSDERPREKARQLGIDHLTDSELLALLLRTGSGSLGVLELAQQLLDDHDGLPGLAGLDVDELARDHGIGPAKAAEIAAAFALGRRLAAARRRQRPTMHTPEDVVTHLRDELVPLRHEEFWCLPLDPRSRLIGEPRVVSRGDVDGTDAGARAFLRIALRAGATSAIAVHNHPSGNVDPSPADCAVTQRLIHAGRTIDITIVDHLIIGDGGRFCSLRREQPALWQQA
ncbi:MAG: RadC family protein [Planctomycetota bacterium]|jgi:DNA repair protein RadC